MSEVPVFELEKVGFSYGEVTALDGVSWRISPGCFWGIVGPNGCGKTTLFDLMARINVPATGTVFYQGRDIREYSRKELAREIALVPQDFYINFSFTVREIVLMGRYPHISRFAPPAAGDLEVVDGIMELLKIDGFKDKYITELSGGERQRVVFARALAQETPVLLLDEGTSNMDIRYTLNLLDMVADKVEIGKMTAIAVFHNINMAATYCRKLVFMQAGKVVLQGNTDEVLNEQSIREIFGIDCRVYFDDYVGARQVAFRRNRKV